MNTVIVTEEKLYFEKLRLSLPQSPDCGAFLYFEGIVRNHNQGKQVSHIVYEAYEGMAKKELELICQETCQEFPIKSLLIAHRTGKLFVGETSLWILAQTAHRKASFDGMQWSISQLKKRVPIWKQEFYVDGTYEWVRCVHAH